MNQPMLRWYTVYYTIRNKRNDQRHKVQVSANSEAEALLRAREHVRTFNNHRIFNPIVTLSDRTI